ncbi:GAF domain-containing protein [Arthrobacter sp. CAN_A2]
MTGAAMSIFMGTANETRVGATDERAIALDEAQFSVGEGPRWDAMRTRAPVMVPDTHAAHLTWPVLGTALADAGAAAVFVLPMLVGAVNIGVVELYHTRPGPLSRSKLLHAVALTGKASWSLMHSILDEGRHGPGMMESEPLARREIHQATGMILVQADVSAAEALMLLRAHAFAHEQSLEDAARAVIGRKLTFSGEPDAVSDSADGEEH